MDELVLDEVIKAPRLSVSPMSQDTVHTYFLDTDIGAPEEYRDLSQILLNAPETDVIRLMINGPGGLLSTAIQLCNLIQTSNAHVEAHILGDACSAQGMITLACHSWITYPSSRVMLHTYRGGMYGKSNELETSLEADKELINTFLRNLAKDFCTEAELDDMLKNGKDIWVQGDNLLARLNNLHEKRLLAEKILEIEMLDEQRKAIEAAIKARLEDEDTSICNQ